MQHGLALAGHECALHLANAIELPAAVERHQPDVIIVGEDYPTRDTSEHIAISTSGTPRNIVTFVENDDSSFIRDALRAGASAYIVNGLGASRIKSIVGVGQPTLPPSSIAAAQCSSSCTRSNAGWRPERTPADPATRSSRLSPRSTFIPPRGAV